MEEMRTNLNEYFRTENEVLYCGDCLDVMTKMQSESIDLIFADPPYNVGKDYGETWNDNLPEQEYLNWVELWVREGFRLLKDTGSFFLLINSKNGHKVANILDKYGYHRNAIIWMKHSAPLIGTKNLAKGYRILYFYSKSDNPKFYYDAIKVSHRYKPGDIIPGRNPAGRNLDDIWDDITELVAGYLIQPEVVRYPNTYKPVSPQQCPKKLVRRVILLSTDIGDTILDPFMGMGTTAVVAEENNRKWVGIEINPEYCEWSVKRLKPIVLQGKLL